MQENMMVEDDYEYTLREIKDLFLSNRLSLRLFNNGQKSKKKKDVDNLISQNVQDSERNKKSFFTEFLNNILVGIDVCNNLFYVDINNIFVPVDDFTVVSNRYKNSFHFNKNLKICSCDDKNKYMLYDKVYWNCYKYMLATHVDEHVKFHDDELLKSYQYDDNDSKQLSYNCKDFMPRSHLTMLLHFTAQIDSYSGYDAKKVNDKLRNFGNID